MVFLKEVYRQGACLDLRGSTYGESNGTYKSCVEPASWRQQVIKRKGLQVGDEVVVEGVGITGTITSITVEGLVEVNHLDTNPRMILKIEL